MNRARTLTIDIAARRAIIAHARRDRPRECCGLLVGHPTAIRFAVPTPNRAASAVRYRVDPPTHIALQRLLRLFAPALSIVGVYHSHPSGDPEPSSSDIAEAHYPQWAHLIVGWRGGRAAVKAFRIQQGRVRELELRPSAGSR